MTNQIIIIIFSFLLLSSNVNLTIKLSVYEYNNINLSNNDTLFYLSLYNLNLYTILNVGTPKQKMKFLLSFGENGLLIIENN